MTHKSRIEQLQANLSSLKVDAYLITHPIDLYYLTGQNLSLGSLLVLKEKAFLLVDGRYFESCEHLGFAATLLSSACSLKSVLTPYKNTVKSLGFSSETTSYKEFLKLQEELSEISLTPCSNLVKEMRAIKEPEEIAVLKKAAALGSEGFDFLLENLKEGISEIELCRKLEIFWKQKGGSGLAFEPIIAFGKNSSMPHYRSSDVPLKRGDTVLLDIGVKYGKYHSDMTRTVFFGKPSDEMKNVYETVRQAQSKALGACRAEAAAGFIDDQARNFIVDAGYGDRFTHGLGHGVGLEIHELPVIKNTPPYGEVVLKTGMCVTIEPGIYLPKVGGVRIEDTIVITKNGYENLTDRSKDLLIID